MSFDLYSTLHRDFYDGGHLYKNTINKWKQQSTIQNSFLQNQSVRT